MLRLTDEQRAVVNHNEGAALVFAVAGAGKTTAMVHRMERLVRERVFAPEQILATSFGKSNERDLRQALSQWPHCRPIRVSTLHALGNDIIRLAYQQRLLKPPAQSSDTTNLSHTILNRTLHEARQRNVPYKRELEGLDRNDFLDYVGWCKGQLRYANLQLAGLPASAQVLAEQADPPSQVLDWYLPLYQLFELVRERSGWITFDDMLLTGWELLQRHPTLLEEMQKRHACVLVDEFQDINLAQAEILDMLTAAHRNYMAIGDDDQTIYQWRGAHPQFILNFPERYDARTYLISDNFRCPAAPLVIANQVIGHNRERKVKRLQLTKGFGGSAESHIHRSVDDMAEAIIKQIRNSGRALREVAVLVRLNAQTPPIEQKLIANEIPYHVTKPFYERSEIAVLIAYCRLAWLERRLRERKPLSGKLRGVFEESWRLVHNRPKRYINRELRQAIPSETITKTQPLATTLRLVAQRLDREYLIDKLEQFANTLDWLTDSLYDEAEVVMHHLDLKLDYQKFLRDSTVSFHVGEGRAASVEAFIEYAKNKGTLFDFMQHIRGLMASKIGRNQAGKNVVTLTTIHQAKGLEWPVVIIPNCNQGIMPFTDMFAAQVDWNAHIEEERRLFYVAVTRTQQRLHLHRVRGDRQSQFLDEARLTWTRRTLDKVETALDRDIAIWRTLDEQTANDIWLIVKQARWLGLERFFECYWQDDEKRAIIGRFIRAVRVQNAAQWLGLRPIEMEFWLRITPESADLTFSGLDSLLPQSTVY